MSIQIGIGSWQPFDASTVDNLSYGDCKALTNYMMSMLEVVGIKSYYTLVKAGRNAGNIIEDFPSNQFNHTILCVPDKNDTLWLECTDQFMPFGYIGAFTDDRKVLVINENGGILTKTKDYSAGDNKKIRYAKVDINEFGGGRASVNTNYQGVYYDEFYTILRGDEKEKLIELNERIHIPNFELAAYNHIERKNIIPAIDEKLELNLRDYGTLFGSRMIIPLNLMDKMGGIPSKTDNRKSDIYIRRAYTEIDTIAYSIPEGYIINKLPENYFVKSDFGEYRFEIINNENEIKYIRFNKVNKGVFPIEKYPDKFNSRGSPRLQHFGKGKISGQYPAEKRI